MILVVISLDLRSLVDIKWNPRNLVYVPLIFRIRLLSVDDNLWFRLIDDAVKVIGNASFNLILSYTFIFEAYVVFGPILD